MKTSLRSAVLQRISPDARRADRAARHRRRRAGGAGGPARRSAGRLTLIAVTAAVLLAGAGYGVRQLTADQRQHLPAAHHGASPAPSASAVSPRPPGQAGDYQVAEQSFTVSEAAGATLGTRILPVMVRYPESGQSGPAPARGDRKSTRLNSSHVKISYAVFCLKKKHRVTHDRQVDLGQHLPGVGA